MTIDLIKDLSGEVFKTVLFVAGPILLISLVVGLLVSIFQAITSLQDATLTFVPKMIAVFLSIFLLFPWLARMLTEFTTNLLDKIPVYIK